MKVTGMVDKLVAAGMPRDAAEIYVHLLHAGPSTAGDLSKHMRFGRSKVYRLLHSLVDAGHVEAGVGTPTVYRAEHPDELFNGLVEDLEAQRRRVEKLEEELLPVLESLVTVEDGNATPSWRTGQGRATAYEMVRKLIKTAETEVVAVAGHPSSTNLNPTVDAMWEAAVERAGEGVKVQILVDERLPAPRRLERYLGVPNLELRRVRLDQQMQFCIVDGREILQWVNLDERNRLSSDSDVVMQSDAPGLVAPPLSYLRSVWASALPLQPTPAGTRERQHLQDRGPL